MSRLVEATYFDGKSASRRSVSVGLERRSNGVVLNIVQNGQIIDRWSVANLRQMRDQATDGIVLESLESHAARLVIEDPTFAEDMRALAPDLNRRPVGSSNWRKLILWGGGAVASVLLILFVIIPGLANQLAPMIPARQEAKLGDTALEQISRFLTGKPVEQSTCSTPEGDKALAKMIARLTPHAESPFEFDIRVLNHRMINAFALPGGHIVLFDGLINKADSAEEVIGVLGHEMGHVVHRDSMRLALRSAGSVGIVGMVFGDFSGGAAAVVLAEQLIQASYAQSAEAAADRYATDLLAAAELPTEPFAEFFVKLIGDDDEQEPGLLSHLASHPDSRGRADATRAANTVTGSFEPVLTDEEWRALRSICKSTTRDRPTDSKSRAAE